MSVIASHHHPLPAPLLRFLVAVGRLVGRGLPVKNSSGLFFFFPFYHTGGAEQVHADIAACFADERPWIFFTKRSRDRRFWKQFTAVARCFDIGLLLKYSYPLSAGLLAGLIGRHPDARVFGCNSLFYYLLLPHLPAHVRASDLLHALGGGAEQFALPVVQRLERRVVISGAGQDALRAFYRAEGVDNSLDSRITVIPNRVSLPFSCLPKPQDGPLMFLFVGRGSAEKRVHLIGRAARRCAEARLPVRFILVGDLAACLEPEDAVYCQLSGRIDDPGRLLDLYQQAHVVLITSQREGFPLTVMEGMAQGCVPVCTAVGAIPEYIRHAENGWLLPADDEAAVVTGLCEAVRHLAQDRQLLLRLAEAATADARRLFSGERFCEAYHWVIRG